MPESREVKVGLAIETKLRNARDLGKIGSALDAFKKLGEQIAKGRGFDKLTKQLGDSARSASVLEKASKGITEQLAAQDKIFDRQARRAKRLAQEGISLGGGGAGGGVGGGGGGGGAGGGGAGASASPFAQGFLQGIGGPQFLMRQGMLPQAGGFAFGRALRLGGRALGWAGRSIVGIGAGGAEALTSAIGEIRGIGPPIAAQARFGMQAANDALRLRAQLTRVLGTSGLVGGLAPLPASVEAGITGTIPGAGVTRAQRELSQRIEQTEDITRGLGVNRRPRPPWGSGAGRFLLPTTPEFLPRVSYETRVQEAQMRGEARQARLLQVIRSGQRFGLGPSEALSAFGTAARAAGLGPTDPRAEAAAQNIMAARVSGISPALLGRFMYAGREGALEGGERAGGLKLLAETQASAVVQGLAGSDLERYTERTAAILEEFRRSGIKTDRDVLRRTGLTLQALGAPPAAAAEAAGSMMAANRALARRGPMGALDWLRLRYFGGGQAGAPLTPESLEQQLVNLETGRGITPRSLSRMIMEQGATPGGRFMAQRLLMETFPTMGRQMAAEMVKRTVARGGIPESDIETIRTLQMPVSERAVRIGALERVSPEQVREASQQFTRIVDAGMPLTKVFQDFQDEQLRTLSVMKDFGANLRGLAEAIGDITQRLRTTLDELQAVYPAQPRSYPSQSEPPPHIDKPPLEKAQSFSIPRKYGTINLSKEY